MKKEQEIANKEFEIADRLIECDGEVKVKVVGDCLEIN